MTGTNGACFVITRQCVYSRTMNKKLLVAIVTILLIIGASITYVLVQKSLKANSEVTTSENTTKQIKPQSYSSNIAKGKYTDYTEDNFALAQGERLLFFHAPWCPQCRELDASIVSSALPDNLTIFKVDYDTNQALRIKYGVTIQTTIVKVDENGEKIESYVAYDKPNFGAVEQALLK